MSKTLESVRNKKFVDATLKRVHAAKEPLPFFCILKHQDDQKPVLLVGNPDAELKKVALQPSGQKIEGKCKNGKGGVEFFTDDTDKEDKFKEAIKKVAKDAGLTLPFVVVLKPASELVEAPEKKTLDELTRAEDGDDEDNVSNLTFDKDSWLKFSQTGSKRSDELKAIDDAFDTFANAKDSATQIDALSGLAKNIQTWLTKKDGNSRRLAMVSTLREQVLAQFNTLQLKDLIKQATEFKIKFAQLGKDHEGELKALEDIGREMDKIQINPNSDAKVKKLTAALIEASSNKIGELYEIQMMKGLALKRGPVLNGPIVSKATRQMIACLEKDSKKLESKAVVDALFDDFCAYGRKKWTYNTRAKVGADLLDGATTGACGTFASQFAKLVNMIIGKNIAKSAMVTARNFITVPLTSIQFIDSACPGNLRMSPEAKPDRYFFTQHYITETTFGKYCPTTGTKDGAVDGVVAKSGFEDSELDKKQAYKLGEEIITLEGGKGYGDGGLYTLHSV